jgi:hypothetical protein
MSCTVFANKNGLFHQGSDGSGSAFPDVCLSPPPAPTGPVPIPYPNKASAGDLSEGSSTVLVQGQPTALKDQSYTSKTSGDSGGTQGGGVVTHRTEGKGYFKFWSLDVLIEGLNADSHSDPMGQNCGSNTINGLCLRSSVVREEYEKALASDCTEAYVGEDHHVDPNTAQTKEATAEFKKNKAAGGGCWECGTPSYDVDDHFPPLVVQWYAGGCHKSEDDWNKQAKETRCRPHCDDCSRKQGTAMKAFNKARKAALGL